MILPKKILLAINKVLPEINQTNQREQKDESEH